MTALLKLIIWHAQHTTVETCQKLHYMKANQSDLGLRNSKQCTWHLEQGLRVLYVTLKYDLHWSLRYTPTSFRMALPLASVSMGPHSKLSCSMNNMQPLQIKWYRGSTHHLAVDKPVPDTAPINSQDCSQPVHSTQTQHSFECHASSVLEHSTARVLYTVSLQPPQALSQPHTACAPCSLLAITPEPAWVLQTPNRGHAQ